MKNNPYLLSGPVIWNQIPGLSNIASPLIYPIAKHPSLKLIGGVLSSSFEIDENLHETSISSVKNSFPLFISSSTFIYHQLPGPNGKALAHEVESSLDKNVHSKIRHYVTPFPITSNPWTQSRKREFWYIDILNHWKRLAPPYSQRPDILISNIVQQIITPGTSLDPNKLLFHAMKYGSPHTIDIIFSILSLTQSEQYDNTPLPQTLGASILSAAFNHSVEQSLSIQSQRSEKSFYLTLLSASVPYSWSRSRRFMLIDPQLWSPRTPWEWQELHFWQSQVLHAISSRSVKSRQTFLHKSRHNFLQWMREMYTLFKNDDTSNTDGNLENIKDFEKFCVSLNIPISASQLSTYLLQSRSKPHSLSWSNCCSIISDVCLVGSSALSSLDIVAHAQKYSPEIDEAPQRMNQNEIAPGMKSSLNIVVDFWDSGDAMDWTRAYNTVLQGVTDKIEKQTQISDTPEENLLFSEEHLSKKIFLDENQLPKNLPLISPVIRSKFSRFIPNLPTSQNPNLFTTEYHHRYSTSNPFAIDSINWKSTSKSGVLAKRNFFETITSLYKKKSSGGSLNLPSSSLIFPGRGYLWHLTRSLKTLSKLLPPNIDSLPSSDLPLQQFALLPPPTILADSRTLPITTATTGTPNQGILAPEISRFFENSNSVELFIPYISVFNSFSHNIPLVDYCGSTNVHKISTPPKHITLNLTCGYPLRLLSLFDSSDSKSTDPKPLEPIQENKNLLNDILGPVNEFIAPIPSHLHPCDSRIISVDNQFFRCCVLEMISFPSTHPNEKPSSILLVVDPITSTSDVKSENSFSASMPKMNPIQVLLYNLADIVHQLAKLSKSKLPNEHQSHNIKNLIDEELSPEEGDESKKEKPKFEGPVFPIHSAISLASSLFDAVHIIASMSSWTPGIPDILPVSATVFRTENTLGAQYFPYPSESDLEASGTTGTPIDKPKDSKLLIQQLAFRMVQSGQISKKVFNPSLYEWDLISHVPARILDDIQVILDEKQISPQVSKHLPNTPDSLSFEFAVKFISTFVKGFVVPAQR